MVNAFYMPTRICFGSGALKQLDNYVSKKDKVLIVTDKGLAKAGIVERVIAQLDSIGTYYEVFDEVEVNPKPDTVQKALKMIVAMNASLIIGLGGGSPLDVAKIASALTTNGGSLENYQWEGRQFAKDALPFIAIPTTAGTGSEVTRVSVIIDRNVKKGIVSDKLFPTIAVVDPEMMTSLPQHLTATTGLDALTHAIEAYIGLGANSFTDSYAVEAIKLLAEYLPRAYANGGDVLAREQVAKASTLAGIAMDQAGLGIIHAMSSPLCSYYDIAHGLSNAVLLPHGMRFNLIASAAKFAKIAECFGCDTTGYSLKEAADIAVESVVELCNDLNITSNFADAFQSEGDAEKFGQEAAETFMARNNPRNVFPENCTEIFKKVFNA